MRTEQKVRVKLGPYKDGAISATVPAPVVTELELAKALQERQARTHQFERINFTGTGASLGHTVSSRCTLGLPLCTAVLLSLCVALPSSAYMGLKAHTRMHCIGVQQGLNIGSNRSQSDVSADQQIMDETQKGVLLWRWLCR